MNKSIFPPIPHDWNTVLSPLLKQPYMQNLGNFLATELSGNTPIYPPRDMWFNALDKTPLSNVKVVILGQDPYHGAGQAHGLSFSVQSGTKMPPSLRNIFKEIVSDLSCPMPQTFDLTPWAKQGVLLLNATLTVRESDAGSHQKKGWETFTDTIIKTISDTQEHVVFLLWGAYAISKSNYIDNAKHTVLTAVHPSPLSANRGFFGCKHFSTCNDSLLSHNQSPIDWTLQGFENQPSLL